MNTTTIARCNVSASVTVSTVRVREGNAVWFETAFIVGGRVSDGLRSERRGAALIEHDAACAWFLYPSSRDSRDRRNEIWARQLAAVNAA